MYLLADIGVCRAGAGIDARHPAITDSREEHGNHGDEDGGDHVTVALVADDPVDAHGRGRLDDHHADDNEVP